MAVAKRFPIGIKYKTLPRCKFYVMSKRVGGFGGTGGINVKCADNINLAGCFADNMVLSRDKQIHPRRSPIYVTPFRPVVSKWVGIYDDYDVRHEYCRKKEMRGLSTGSSLATIKRHNKWGNKYKIKERNGKVSFTVIRKSQ